MGFVALMIASSQTVCAEEINWQKATEIAKRYVTLPQDDGMKAKENGKYIRMKEYIILGIFTCFFLKI